MNLTPTDIVLLGSIAVGAVLASVSVVLTLSTVRGRKTDASSHRGRRV